MVNRIMIADRSRFWSATSQMVFRRLFGCPKCLYFPAVLSLCNPLWTISLSRWFAMTFNVPTSRTWTFPAILKGAFFVLGLQTLSLQPATVPTKGTLIQTVKNYLIWSERISNVHKGRRRNLWLPRTQISVLTERACH